MRVINHELKQPFPNWRQRLKRIQRKEGEGHMEVRTKPPVLEKKTTTKLVDLQFFYFLTCVLLKNFSDPNQKIKKKYVYREE